MSNNLYYEPDIKRGRGLSTELKFMFRQRFGEPVDTIIRTGEQEIAFLDGIRVATANVTVKQEISEILSALDQYGAVKVWEQE